MSQYTILEVTHRLYHFINVSLFRVTFKEYSLYLLLCLSHEFGFLFRVNLKKILLIKKIIFIRYFLFFFQDI